MTKKKSAKNPVIESLRKKNLDLKIKLDDALNVTARQGKAIKALAEICKSYVPESDVEKILLECGLEIEEEAETEPDEGEYYYYDEDGFYYFDGEDD